MVGGKCLDQHRPEARSRLGGQNLRQLPSIFALSGIEQFASGTWFPFSALKVSRADGCSFAHSLTEGGAGWARDTDTPAVHWLAHVDGTLAALGSLAHLQKQERKTYIIVYNLLYSAQP